MPPSPPIKSSVPDKYYTDFKQSFMKAMSKIFSENDPGSSPRIPPCTRRDIEKFKQILKQRANHSKTYRKIKDFYSTHMKDGEEILILQCSLFSMSVGSAYIIQALGYEDAFDCMYNVHLENQHCSSKFMQKKLRKLYQIPVLCFKHFMKLCPTCNQPKSERVKNISGNNWQNASSVETTHQKQTAGNNRQEISSITTTQQKLSTGKEIAIANLIEEIQSNIAMQDHELCSSLDDTEAELTHENKSDMQNNELWTFFIDENITEKKLTHETDILSQSKEQQTYSVDKENSVVNLTEEKAQQTEPLTYLNQNQQTFRANVYLNTIKMKHPDDLFRYVLIYHDSAMLFTVLRPLISLDASEIAVELMKIFADFGPPRKFTIYEDHKRFFVKVFSEFNKIYPGLFNMESLFNVITYRKYINRRICAKLRAWMQETNSRSWGIGCHIVQWRMNTEVFKYVIGSENETHYLRIIDAVLRCRQPKERLSNKRQSSKKITELVKPATSEPEKLYSMHAPESPTGKSTKKPSTLKNLESSITNNNCARKKIQDAENKTNNAALTAPVNMASNTITTYESSFISHLEKENQIEAQMNLELERATNKHKLSREQSNAPKSFIKKQENTRRRPRNNRSNNDLPIPDYSNKINLSPKPITTNTVTSSSENSTTETVAGDVLLSQISDPSHTVKSSSTQTSVMVCHECNKAGFLKYKCIRCNRYVHKGCCSRITRTEKGLAYLYLYCVTCKAVKDLQAMII